MTLHYITLHYITNMHTYVRTYIHTYIHTMCVRICIWHRVRVFPDRPGAKHRGTHNSGERS